MNNWFDDALKLSETIKSYKEITSELQNIGHDVNYEQVKKRFYLHSKKGIDYVDKKEYDKNDIEEYLKAVRILQEKMYKLDTKQVSAKMNIGGNKPIAIAFWGDWHEGSVGTDYKTLDTHTDLIKNTDGLYFIGTGDYKDNYISGTHAGGNFEQIIRPGMQDIAVQNRMENVKHKCIALTRGCHDDWDKKQADKDFISTLCEITKSVNLWHGGDIHINVGQQHYHLKVRHKFPFESSINLENSMRRIMETQGACDVACSAHLHNPFFMERHLMGEFRILMRSGSYKIYDEYAQKIGGYKGKVGVPVVILYPDQRKIIPMFLEEAIEFLNFLRFN